MCMTVSPAYIYNTYMCAVPVEARRGHQDPELELQALVSRQVDVVDLVPLQEQQMHLNMELSFHKQTSKYYLFNEIKCI